VRDSFEPKEQEEQWGPVHSGGKGEGGRGGFQPRTWPAATRCRKGGPGWLVEARNLRARRRSATGGSGEENGGRWAGSGN
jgi:hypothetical protein